MPHVNLHAHKHTNTVAVPPTCFVYRADISAPSPSLVQTCTTKDRKGPTQWPRGPVRNPQVCERNRQKEGNTGLYLTTDLLARSRARTNAAAVRPEDSQSSETLQSPGSPGLNRAAPSLAAGKPVPLLRVNEEEVKKNKQINVKKKVRERSLLLLFDGLDAFHQVVLRLSVRVQRLVLGDHGEIRTDLLTDLYNTQHQTLMMTHQLHPCVKPQ